MPILLPEAIQKVQARKSLENSVKLDLLVLLMTKPVQFLAEIPQDWVCCLHIDMLPPTNPETGEKCDWLDPVHLRRSLDSLVCNLAALGRIPVDICAVKSANCYSIVVKTREPEILAA